MTKVGIVYGASSKSLRRVILPDRENELASHAIAAGEAMLTPDMPDLQTVESITDWAKAEIELATGVKPSLPRCAEIKDGKVVAVRMADPEIDTIAGALLVKSSEADVGWDYTVKDGFVAKERPKGEPKQGGDPLI